PTLAWIAIGCAGLAVVLGVVAMIAGWYIFGKAKQLAGEIEEDPIAATAKLVAAASPDIELVKADKESQRVTFRNVKTGEELTFSYQDIQEGKVSFSSEGKEATIGVDTEGQGGITVTSEEGTFRAGGGSADYPAWLPTYPGAEAEGNFTTDTPSGRAGTFTFRTHDRMEDVLDFFAQELEERDFEIQARTTTPAGALLSAQAKDESKTVNVAGTLAGGQLQVSVQFTEKNR
ncbi:MAG: hypothetical protein L0191_05150, partial [Acidobacteria bacterium]|nr:hypothetical protein [Acidobacteriota bacterium]